MKHKFDPVFIDSLDELLEVADGLFTKTYDETWTYNFSLGKFPKGWNFSVVNSWQKWLDKGYRYEFGAYPNPQAAVRAFLMYVKVHEINVRRLME